MMMQQLGCLFLILTIPLQSFSQERFDLEQLIDIALKQNLSIQIEQENVRQKEFSKIDNDRLRWPNLSLSGSTTNDLSDQTGSVSVNLNQPLYQGGAIHAKQEIADIELKKSNLNYIRKKQTLIKDIQLAYIDLLEAIELEKQESLSLIQLREQARISKVLYSEGDVWKNDVLQADVSIAQGETQVIAAKNKVLLRKSALNILLNFDLNKRLEVEGELAWQDHQWTWGNITENIESSHPELHVAKLNEDVAKLGISNQKSKNLPTVNLSSSLAHSEYFTSDVEASNNMNITLSASWRFWDAGNTNRDISGSRIEKKKKSMELYNKRQSLLQQAQQSWLNFIEAKSQVKVLKQAIGIAEENYRVNTVRYQEKLGTANDLLTAQTLLSKSRKDWVSALARYLKAAYTLKFNLADSV